VRVVYYTEKTVAQCMSALTERLNAKSSRHLEGWVEKNGHFELSIVTSIVGKLSRRTYLRGKAERDSGITKLTLNVSSGADRRGQLIIFFACALVAVTLFAAGQIALGLLIVGCGAALYIPLAGDQRNSPHLISEVQRTLKASAKPPKKSSETRSTTRTGDSKTRGTSR
jgi:hypothetical protein